MAGFEDPVKRDGWSAACVSHFISLFYWVLSFEICLLVLYKFEMPILNLKGKYSWLVVIKKIKLAK